MIIVKIIGGLGNQMFQIAFAKALAIDKYLNLFYSIRMNPKFKSKSKLNRFFLKEYYIRMLKTVLNYK